jgi:23S rRNA (pseudouridine1915-N3)-methyltransferase
MRTITVVCVGELKESYLREACAEYKKRLTAFCRFSVVEVDEERLPDNPSTAQIEHALKVEGQRLLSKTSARMVQIPLCIEGRELTSIELSSYMDKMAVNGQGDIAFLIGGSWGLSDEVKKAGHFCLSMSPMTFPHQLARVMLLEQVYRAMQITSGGKYHK